MVPASLSAMAAAGHPGLVIPDSRMVRRTGRFRIDLPRFAGVTIGQLSVLGRSVTSLKNLGAGRQMSRNARYDLAVANLRVAPVSSTGGNLCFADPHSDPAALLIAVGASMLYQSVAPSSAPAASPLMRPACRVSAGTWDPGTWDRGGAPRPPVDERRGPDRPRRPDRPDHPRHQPRAHSFQAPSEAFSVAFQTSKARSLVGEEYR